MKEAALDAYEAQFGCEALLPVDISSGAGSLAESFLNPVDSWIRSE